MTILFLTLAGLTIAGFAGAMTLRNNIHCILSLALGLVGLALLYLELGAEFVGFTQVLVYVGAVAILAVFAIMMTKGDGSHPEKALSSSWIYGAGIAVAVFTVLGSALLHTAAPAQTARPDAAVTQIGQALMHQYVLPMEIMALLLTAALIGAVVLAMPEKKGDAR